MTRGEILLALQDALHALAKALSAPNVGPAAYTQLQAIAATLTSIESMLQLPQESMDPTTLLNVMCAGIKDYEGWAAPGESLNGTHYPQGTTAWQCKNPGNLRCIAGNRANWNHLATGSRNNFCVFKDEATGMQAQKNVILAVAAGKATSGPYHDAAMKAGLANSGELSLLQYITVRDPAADSNDPAKYAQYLAERMGVDSATWQLKGLLA